MRFSTRFVHFIKFDRQFTPSSIQLYRSRASLFLRWAGERCTSISTIEIDDVDEVLASRSALPVATSERWACNCQVLRTFFRFLRIAGMERFCDCGRHSQPTDPTV